MDPEIQTPTISPTPTVAPTPTPSIAPVVAPPTAQTVYSAGNIAQATTAPVKPPNLSDPYGLYDQFMNSAEIQAARAKVAEGQAQINAVQQGLRTTTTALQNQNEQAQGGTGASINLIGKQVGRARELTSNELSALGETQNAYLANLASLREDAGNRYQIAQQERGQLQDLIMQTGGEAGINFTDSYEKAMKKASKYFKKQEKDALKKSNKEELRKMALQMGINPKNLSRRELEKVVSGAIAAKNAPKGGSGGKSNFAVEANALKQKYGGDWNKVAADLWKKYDISPGSANAQTLDAIMLNRAPAKPQSKPIAMPDMFDPVTGEQIYYVEE